MRPERDLPDAPRCRSCGRFMQVEAERERLVVYGCCGTTKCLFKPEFRPPPERLRRRRG
jgi:hypothetical protein